MTTYEKYGGWWSLLSDAQHEDVFNVYQLELGKRLDTKMGIQEQEALARQLHAIWKEAYGHTETVKWEKEAPAFREAWIQVAQFVMVQNPPSVIVFNNVNPSEVKAALDQFKAGFCDSEPFATDANPITRIQPVQVVSGYDDYPDHK